MKENRPSALEVSDNGGRTDLKEALLKAQFQALVTQRADMERQIWQVPLAVFAGIAVLFNATPHFAALLGPRHSFAAPAGAGVITLIYAVVTVCRLRVGRAIREQQLKRIIKDAGGLCYLVEPEMFRGFIKERRSLSFTLGGISISRLSLFLLSVIFVGLAAVLVWSLF